MRRPSCRLKLFLGAALGAVLLLTPPAAAARLLQVYIEQDGKVVAHTYYDDGGRADATTVWRYLATPPIMVDDDVTAIEVDDPPLEAKLAGDPGHQISAHRPRDRTSSAVDLDIAA